MGPSVKFVSAIKDATFNKKMGVSFFSGKKDHTQVGGSEGEMVKYQHFSLSLHPSLRLLHCYIVTD